MNCYVNFEKKIQEIVGNENIEINALMKNHTSFKVGGPVDILVTPETYKQVQDVILVCNKNSIPFYILGNGSNIIVKDGGIRGVVIKLCKLKNISIDGDTMICGSGALISSVSKKALNSNLTGLEFACGIPGSVGGAAAMNAGAYKGEMSQIIESAVVVTSKGNIRRLSNKELEFSYRTSAVLKYNLTVLEVTFRLKEGNYDDIKEKMKLLTRKRIERQPLEYPSAGSTFKRPEGFYAAKLIEDSGLKGVSVGGAEVSKKHSGFIINKGDASAKDILQLIDIVQKKVKEEFNVELNTEVKIIGED